MKNHTFQSVRNEKQWAGILLLAIMAMLLAACGSAQSSPAAESIASDAAFAVEQKAAMAPEPAGNFADGESVPVEDYLASAVAQSDFVRVIIYTGNISMVVKDTEETVQAINQLAAEQGGYVSGSNVYQAGEVLRGSLSLRVPAERYATVMEQLRGLSLRVERESSNTEDVTEEFTDLQARKKNLEVTENALQSLLNERQRVGSTSDILEVQRELTQVRGDIERIEGRMRFLANQSALSTINIELIPDILYQPISVAGWQPGGVAKEALQSLIDTLQGLANILIWVVIYVAPLLLIFLIPVVVLVLVIRLWWKRRKVTRQPKKADGAKKADSGKSAGDE